MDEVLNAYCGTPPEPSELLARWTLDPILAAAIAIVFVGYMTLQRAARRGGRRAFALGWFVVALAFMSPLCALSVSLFSARVGQHIVLMFIAAPLLGFACGRAIRARPLWAAMVFSSALWFWHAPAPYAATFRADAIYWVMHVMLLGSATWLWQSCLPGAGRAGAAAAGFLFVAMQMGLLGALLTFAPQPLFAPHSLTTQAWGLTPLDDQQLGGVLMWAVGGLIVAALAVGCANWFLSRLANSGASGPIRHGERAPAVEHGAQNL